MSTVLACFSSEENFDEWKKIVSLESFSHKNTTMMPLKMFQRLWKSVQPLSLSPSWFWPAWKAAHWQGSQGCNWKHRDLLSLWAGGLTPFVHPYLRAVITTREKVQMGKLWVHLQITTLFLNVPACFMAVLADWTCHTLWQTGPQATTAQPLPSEAVLPQHPVHAPRCTGPG